MPERHEKSIWFLMSLNAIGFVAVFLAVGSGNRLAADDFHYLMKTEELGIWDSMLFYYHNWNPRWSATLVVNMFLGNFNGTATFLLFHSSTLLLGMLAIYSFLRAIVSHLSLPTGRPQLAILAGYLLAALFYGSFAKDGTWYWITAAPMYLWGSFAALLGGSLILHKWDRPLRIFLAGLLFLYAGGASETVAIATLTILFFLGFTAHGKQSAIRIDRTALHVATIACLIGFGIDIIGPGAQVRYGHLPHYSLGDRLLIGFWNYIKFIFREIPLKLPAIIMFVSPLAYFGRKHLRFQIISLREVLWDNRRLWALTDILILLLSFVLAFVMGEMGPARAWVPLTFMVVTLAAVLAYRLGTWAYIRSGGRLIRLVLSAQIVLLGLQCRSGFQQIPMAREYAAAVDRRMAMIEAEQTNGPCLIALKPLPDSGWLFTSDITNDTAHFRNRHLKLYFGNRCNIVLEDTVTSTSE